MEVASPNELRLSGEDLEFECRPELREAFAVDPDPLALQHAPEKAVAWGQDSGFRVSRVEATGLSEFTLTLRHCQIHWPIDWFAWSQTGWGHYTFDVVVRAHPRLTTE